MLFGVIADDITGGTDIASVIMRTGCRVVQTFGVPEDLPGQADVVVVATKSRMAPPDEARTMVGEAADFLIGLGAQQLFFKYCSTFDSTERGNIGPITDFLLDRCGAPLTVMCPSYPALARTVYQGHLFVGDRLISESSMRNHPLTPMTDPDLVRFLGRQTRSKVSLAPLRAVEAGTASLSGTIDALAESGARMVIVDAILDHHVATVAESCRALPLLTGGAALGGALAAVHRAAAAETETPVEHPRLDGPAAILSGSCSTMTLAQVSRIVNVVPSYNLDPLVLATDQGAVQGAIDWALAQADAESFLIYSTADPGRVAGAQSILGRDQAATSLETAFSSIARALADAGVRRFVVAGGETSGAVTNALGVRTMAFVEEVAPGVPLVRTIEPESYSLILKSGNFGDPDFFERAIAAI